MDIIVKAKYGTSQEECLRDVHEDTVGDVFFVHRLKDSDCNAADDKQHCTT